ncbi:MAG: 4-hydroxy-tetrahydrodipicolinate reductase [Candidatus Methylomirabilales bacterium]
MIRVGVFGAGGRMGGEVCRAVHADPDITLVAAVDPRVAGRPVSSVAGISGVRLVVSDEAEALLDAEADVAVDFTVAPSALENIRWCIRHAMHVVVGTTGISEKEIEGMRALLEEEGGESNVIIAPNFAIGAVLMMQFARTAATWFPDVELIEMHHAVKRDVPSGTSLAMLRHILAGRSASESEPLPEGDWVETLPGARGAQAEGVRIHSLRLPGLVAHHEVIFGGHGQTLTIRHDSMERSSFMPGVLLAIREISKRPGLTVGLEPLLGL